LPSGYYEDEAREKQVTNSPYRTENLANSSPQTCHAPKHDRLWIPIASVHQACV